MKNFIILILCIILSIIGVASFFSSPLSDSDKPEEKTLTIDTALNDAYDKLVLSGVTLDTYPQVNELIQNFDCQFPEVDMTIDQLQSVAKCFDQISDRQNNDGELQKIAIILQAYQSDLSIQAEKTEIAKAITLDLIKQQTDNLGVSSNINSGVKPVAHINQEQSAPTSAPQQVQTKLPQKTSSGIIVHM